MNSRWAIRATVIAACCAALTGVGSSPARASTAYGDLNNFDVFNDTGTDCHGFEIELEDVRSTDVTYTYDYNHYGAPTITEDRSDPLHPRVVVRYAARYDAATGAFSALTVVPPAPPSPTDGHQCTNPSVNIGCEHFGVGYYGAPSVVRYHWLVADPASPGSLVRGPAVNVATPSWTYYPIAANQPVAQVQAVILAPPPPPAPVYEFGDAVWVKVIVTTSHNNQVVELRDLVSDDPDDPADTNWANGEPDEVEVEWRLMQTEFNNPDGANNELAGENEDLPDGDEVITRRYEFYGYSGPLDPETNEAKCDNYPQIADPADASYKAECDPATVTVLGDYIGAQMAGFNVEAVLGLIDHIQDGDLGQEITARTVVVGGNTPYVTTVGPGSLPAGLVIDSPTGVLSGTPTVAGDFSFTITATDADAAQVTRAYTLHVGDAADECPDDPAKLAPGACGCGVADTDSDGDGTADCTDQCPADAAKVAPGACGCGVADTDSDGDGTADCTDQCPADAAKVAPGACGCGVADTDSDGDSTADCTDQCPADAAKLAPGACGCGVADTDSDGNGTVDCLEPQGADLALAMKMAPRSVVKGRPMELRLRVRNKGPESARSLTTQLDCSGVPYRIVESDRDCVVTPGANPSLTCSDRLLRAGETAEIELHVVPRAAGTLSCTATVASSTPDPDPTNQSKTVTATVRPH